MRIRPGLIDLAFLGFIIVVVVVEVFNATDLGHSPWFNVPLALALSYVAMLAARLVVTSKVTLIAFLRGLTMPAIVVSAIAVLQLLRVPGVEQLLSVLIRSDGLDARIAARWDIRATSTIGHWTALGGYLAAITAAGCLDLLISRRKRSLHPWPVVVIAVALAGEVATLTFATVGVAVAVVGLTVLAIGARPILVILAVIVAFGGWGIFGQDISNRLEAQSGGGNYAAQDFSWLPQTVGYRANIWLTETSPAIAQRPLTGWGWQVYTATSEGWVVKPGSLVWGSPESEWFRTLISGGWASLAAEIALLLSGMGVIIASRRSLGLRPVAPVLATFIGLIVISSIHSHFANAGVPLVLWPLIGALIPFGRPIIAMVAASDESVVSPIGHVVLPSR